MIAVKRLNGEEMMVNPHLIETIEARPDTVIAFASGKRLVVRDDVTELVERIIDYRRMIGDRNSSDFDGSF